MNWKKRIQPDGSVDCSGVPYYFITFSEKSRIQEVYGYKAILPVEPPDENCVNFGLPEKEQIFRRTHRPKDLAKWEKKDKESFIASEYNKRHNGQWQFIKGQKFYITGPFWFFLNHWTSLTTNKLIFRFTDLEFFIMWMFACYDPKCYGVLDDKCRQAGDTEKAICIIYEYTTRVSGVKAAMQSINEDDIFDNAYSRILHAHGEMVFYMRATNRGTSDPREGLIFDYQRETLSKGKMLKNQQEHGVAQITYEEYEYPPLNSSILYGATKAHVFGTGTYGRYYNDEHGKWQLADPLYTWNVVKQAMYNKITNQILGKAIFTSTVEELSGGETLKTAKKFWNQSDPTKLNSNGETLTGLYRIFRGALDCAPPDHWGFPQKELALAKIKSDIAAYMAIGDIKGMIEYRRMNGTHS